MLCGLLFALDLGFWHYGLKYTSVGASTVLSNLAPVVVTAFAWIFLKQRPRALFLLAMTVAVAGAWIMGAGRGAGTPVLNAPLGNLLSLATAFWYALYFLAIAQGRKTQAASRLMFWSGVVGAPLLLVSALLLGEQILPTTLAGLAACVGLGLVHFAGQGSIAWAMGRLPTALASVVVLVQPVVATYAGFLLFGEALGPMQTLGAGRGAERRRPRSPMGLAAEAGRGPQLLGAWKVPTSSPLATTWPLAAASTWSRVAPAGASIIRSSASTWK